MQHPLLFLTVKSFLNGLRRALTSGRRLVSLLFLGAYYLFIFGRQAFRPGMSTPPSLHQKLITLPPTSSLEAGVFLVFAGLTLLMSPNLFSSRGGFKQADIDVLFATPVDPKHVLLFRVARDFVLTLLIPVFFGVVTWRQTSSSLKYVFDHFPELGGYAFKAAWLAWIFMSMAFVTIGYAAGMSVNRGDATSYRNRKLLAWSIAGLIAVTILYSAVRLRTDLSWDTAVSITQNPGIRLAYFMASAATAIVMTTLNGNFLLAAGGIGVMVAVIGGSLWAAMRQASWMYDQAASRGLDDVSSMTMRRRGDSFAIMADQARRGKIKRGRFSGWIGKYTVTGPAAMIWRESIVQARAGIWRSIVLLPLAGLLVVIPVWTAGALPIDTVGPIYVGSLALIVLMSGLQTVMAFMEMLRRVDIQKPLPFSASTIVAWEVIGKSLPTTLLSVTSAIACIAIRPAMWTYGISSIFSAATLSLLVASATFLVSVLFPDFEDPTQRGFRQLMLLLGVALLAAPGVGIYLGGLFLKLSPFIIAAIAGAVNLFISGLACYLAGNFYASYNPSE